MRPNPASAALSAAVAALVLAGCGGGADKAGGERTTKPTVLTLANGNGDNVELQPFADAVRQRSAGSLRIDFKNGWREGARDYEAGVIHDVSAGKADLGWAGTRAFDDVGVSSFDALHAPLLIDSYALERRTLESPLVAEMLKGLDKVGLAGIGILPGPLRRPLGVSSLVTPDDYRGATVALQRSQVGEQTLQALGASAAEIPSAGDIGAYDGVEQQIGAIAGNEYDKVASKLTANVSLWPRPVVLFANPKALERLSAEQRAALRGAARAALPATQSLVEKGDAEGARILCVRRVKFLTAGDADLAALRRAVQPVYDRLERRAPTKAAIARIRSLRVDGEAGDAPRCAASDAAQPAASGQTQAGKRTPLDGVYRLTTTREESAESSGESVEETVSENYGQFRFVFDRGLLRYTQASEGNRRWTQADYTVKGHVLTIEITGYGGEAPNGAAEKTGEVFTYRWSLYRDRLTLGPVAGAVSPTVWSVKPWRRIGDAP
jgi:TRAP-type C4-dicarboxylate transport system substrate-binding protein